ncbi:hypothetical protein GCM10025875_36060 [Litorihabitans aurantiacus]|uniref:Uncharacterized protein n=1 Tax=Litorihabitans aurantiacus TaxID=1930061 RepID=A0AA37XIA2_9MICO|nr:hypothetical protein GCM10025875_35260 [Litorihabitans aurantiacus]GMA33614.1 hypothetical protein GCM10025875_36060 [Litorihabitans aurantiacus]
MTAAPTPIPQQDRFWKSQPDDVAHVCVAAVMQADSVNEVITILANALPDWTPRAAPATGVRSGTAAAMTPSGLTCTSSCRPRSATPPSVGANHPGTPTQSPAEPSTTPTTARPRLPEPRRHLAVGAFASQKGTTDVP